MVNDNIFLIFGYLASGTACMMMFPQVYLTITEKKVNDFLEDLYQKALPAAKKEWEELVSYAKKNLNLDQIEKWDKSDELYTKLIALNDRDAQAYNNFAYSLVERDEDLEYALTLAEKAIQISPDVSAYLDTIGWIYYKLSEFEKAKDFIAQALIYDDSSAVILEHYGDVLISVEEIDEALIFYNKALLLDEDNEQLQTKISSYESQ